MEFSSSKPSISLLVVLLLGLTHLPPPCAAVKERCHPHDKMALLQIKQQSFNNSVLFDSWNPTSDCCSDTWFFVNCDANNRVNSLIILDTDTEGTPFPAALGRLPYLQQVVFSNNATGPVPHSLANLRRILLIDFRYNSLTGPIPAFFAGLKNLTSLELSNNKLTGSIPPILALSPSLANLHLRSNQLTGPVPESFGSFKNQQFDLDLSDNKLSGELPRSLENMNFFGFKVAGNKLKGDASFMFGKNKTTSFLDLSRNSFSFDMSNLEFSTMLNILDISHNKIYGGLPAGLGDLPELNVFNVSYNRLCGPVPTGGSLKQFDATTYFHDKCLCGSPLPPCK